MAIFNFIFLFSNFSALPLLCSNLDTAQLIYYLISDNEEYDTVFPSAHAKKIDHGIPLKKNEMILNDLDEDFSQEVNTRYSLSCHLFYLVIAFIYQLYTANTLILMY